MRLFQINTTGNWGSTGRIAEQLGQTVIADGWKSVIACARNIRQSSSDIYKICGMKTVYANVLWQRIFDCDSPFSIIATRKLISEIQKQDPDVIHLHNLHGYYLNANLLLDFLAEYNKPVVWTLHDCWILTGHCCHFLLADCQKWQRQCGRCPQKKVYPSSYVFDNSAKNHKEKIQRILAIKKLHFVAISDWIKSLISQSPLKCVPTTTIRNGVDLAVFKPMSDFPVEKYGIGAKKVVLFVSSVWSKEKGFDFIPKIANALGPEFDCVVVGASDAQIKSLSKYGVYAIKRTENTQELAKLYSYASVVANPTLQEGLSMVNIEAICCGTPVITFDSGGTRETIVNEKNGAVVACGDVSAMVEKIKEYASKDKKYFYEDYIESAKTHFDKNIAWNKYLELYNALI